MISLSRAKCLPLFLFPLKFFISIMSNLQATYNNSTTKVEHTIQVPLDTNKPLTDSIIALQADINTYLTSVLEAQSTKVTTVQEDEAEKERQEEEAEEEEEDSPMQVDKPEVSEEQALKKQKTN